MIFHFGVLVGINIRVVNPLMKLVLLSTGLEAELEATISPRLWVVLRNLTVVDKMFLTADSACASTHSFSCSAYIRYVFDAFFPQLVSLYYGYCGIPWHSDREAVSSTLVDAVTRASGYPGTRECFHGVKMTRYCNTWRLMTKHRQR